MPAASRKKTLLILGAAALAVVLLAVVLLNNSRPRPVYWSGTAESFTNDDPAPAELVLDIKRYAPFFGKTYYTGSVTVNGRR